MKKRKNKKKGLKKVSISCNPLVMVVHTPKNLIVAFDGGITLNCHKYKLVRTLCKVFYLYGGGKADEERR